MVFVAFALFDNIAGIFRHFPQKEPIGFAFFLAALGYVAAKRSLHRDQQFNDLQKELEIARRIQTSILPSPYPQSAHFHVAARYVPMTAVAGDFYDFLIADQIKPASSSPTSPATAFPPRSSPPWSNSPPPPSAPTPPTPPCSYPV